jgi:DNA-binding MarR family transcriptional regulator
MISEDFVETIGLPLLAHRLRRLSDAMVHDVGELFGRRSIALPPRAGSLVMLLDQCGQLPITVAAKRLRLSHPLVITLARKLGDSGLLVTISDPDDSRRRLLSLTGEGQKLGRFLYDFNRSLSSTFEQMFEEAGIDLFAAVQAFEKAAKRRSFHDRLGECLDKTFHEKVHPC